MQKIYIVLVAIISMAYFSVKANQETGQISSEDLKCWKACVLRLITDKKGENGYSKEKCEDILAKILVP